MIGRMICRVYGCEMTKGESPKTRNASGSGSMIMTGRSRNRETTVRVRMV